MSSSSSTDSFAYPTSYHDNARFSNKQANQASRSSSSSDIRYILNTSKAAEKYKYFEPQKTSIAQVFKFSLDGLTQPIFKGRKLVLAEKKVACRIWISFVRTIRRCAVPLKSPVSSLESANRTSRK